MKNIIEQKLLTVDGRLSAAKFKTNEGTINSILQTTKFLPQEASIGEHIYCAYKGLNKRPVCKTCKNKVNFLRFSDGYRQFCSSNCSIPQRTASAKVTTLKRYGVENQFQRPSIKQKTKNTNLQKYGVENPQQNKKIKAKTLKTNKGNNTISEVNAKRRATMVDRYGVEHSMQNPASKKKAVATFRNRYGVDSPLQAPEIQAKVKRTNKKRYGVEHPMQSPSFVAQLGYERWGKQHHIHNFSQWENDNKFSIFAEGKTIWAVCEYFNVTNTIVYQRCKKLKVELDWKRGKEHQFFKCLPDGFETNTRQAIPPKELDVYYKEHKLALEFNGSYWHSSANTHKKYHQEKTTRCHKEGIQLIHVWEYLWDNPQKRDIYLSMVRAKLGKNKRVYARKCGIRKIDTPVTFYEENHLQGSCPATISYGLFHKDILVSCMSFRKPRFDKTHALELVRYCTKKNITVVGGASKLFKPMRGTPMVCYASLDHSTGKVYEKLGFTLSHISSPGYVYFGHHEIISRYKAQKHKLAKLLPKFDTALTEEENMKANNYFRLYDSGNKVFHYVNK